VLSNIAIFGRTGSGKTTVAEYLAEKYGYARSNVGSTVREICKLLFNSESKTLLNQVCDAMKAIDENVWLRTALSTIASGQLVVFDSMRFRNDYEYLSKQGFYLWKISAPLDVRIARLHERGQEFDPGIDELYRGEVELENYVFDSYIDNSICDIYMLYKEIDRIINHMIDKNQLKENHDL